MRKNSILFLLLSLCCGAAFSQSAGAVSFADAGWERRKIASKTRLVHHHFNQKNLFGANQNITYIDLLNTGRPPVLELAAEPQLLKPTSEFGRSAGALAAINGTFFDVKNGGSVDFIKINDTVLHENRLETAGQRKVANVILLKTKHSRKSGTRNND